MKKVLEYLLSSECLLSQVGEYTLKPKENGHYGLFATFGLLIAHPDGGRFEISCNNETMMFISFKLNPLFSIGKYHYLQTYEHIQRGEPDENGYYARSTQEEVIKYLKYLQKEYTK